MCSAGKVINLIPISCLYQAQNNSPQHLTELMVLYHDGTTKEVRNWNLSELEFVRIGNCQNHNFSKLEFFRIGIFQNWNLSELEFVRIGICQNRNLSELEFVRIGICQN